MESEPKLHSLRNIWRVTCIYFVVPKLLMSQKLGDENEEQWLTSIKSKREVVIAPRNINQVIISSLD